MGKSLTKIARELIEKPGIIVAPGTYDALTAKLAESVGFKMVFHSGYGTAASLLGQPDVGLVCFKEMCERVKYMARAINIPLLCDADTGYGNAINAYRTVKEYIWAGASGLFIEDQLWPKRCGHMEGKQLIPLEEMIGKIKAAIDARNEEDPDFLVGARTDAIAVCGFEEAIRRGRAYREAGADFIFIEAPTSLDQLEKIPKLIPDTPLLLNLIEKGKTPFITVKEAEELGYKIVIHSVFVLYTAAKAVKEALSYLRENGITPGYENMMPFPEFAEFIGLPQVREMEKKYLPKEILEEKYRGQV
ncbi:MAG: isocitrate lyase/PEP mutase family protein [Synergistetes bacterium]|nr:isocitrate lyase/PEP mutase family protein [Synergistota bacterium]